MWFSKNIQLVIIRLCIFTSLLHFMGSLVVVSCYLVHCSHIVFVASFVFPTYFFFFTLSIFYCCPQKGSLHARFWTHKYQNAFLLKTVRCCPSSRAIILSDFCLCVIAASLVSNMRDSYSICIMPDN